MRRLDSAAIVPKTRELLPDPETPVKTVSRRLGRSTSTSCSVFSRAPRTRMRSWESAAWVMGRPSGAATSTSEYASPPAADDWPASIRLRFDSLASLGRSATVSFPGP